MRLDIVSEVNVAYLVRYLVLTAIVVLVQNYANSFTEERRSVWNAPPSFAKYSFLVTRHIPIFCGIIGFIPLSGFQGLLFSNDQCGWIFCVVTVLITVSLTINNILAALHVIKLWDGSKVVSRGLSVGFALSYTSAIVSLFIGLSKMKAGMVWNPLLNICTVGNVSGWMIATAAPPLAFELVMLVSVCINSIDRPRSAAVPLHFGLFCDGFVFFVCTTIFRTIQLALAATLDPGLATLGLLSVSFTCLISIIFNQRAFARQYRRVTAVDEQAAPRGSTPLPVSFNRLVTRRPDTPDKPQWSPGASVELGQVHVETRQD